MNLGAVKRMFHANSGGAIAETTAGAVRLKLSKPHDRDAILRFIEEMGFNPRDVKTWDALNMLAMTAWDGDRLVGAIPLEPRQWQIRPGCTATVIHQTTVGVAPACQSRGIGSLMQDAIFQIQPASSVIATVFREDEISPAYRWYTRNGFQTAVNIVAWMLESPAENRRPTPPYEVLDPQHPGVDWADIELLWRRLHADQYGGFVCRRQRPRRDWLEAHPYRGIYKFKILLMREAGELTGYAILGVGKLHSSTVRVEIMEHAVRDADADHNHRLVQAVCEFAADHDYRPVRWAMSVGDPETAVARSLGFKRSWVFNLLMRPLPNCDFTLPGPQERRECWRYHSLDYS